MNIIEYNQWLCGELIAAGISFSYNCLAECKRYGEDPHGEGEYIVYYSGFDYPQADHGRFWFCAEDKDIWFSHSWGVQGLGFHSDEPLIVNPTAEQLRAAVENVVRYLKSVRIETVD